MHKPSMHLQNPDWSSAVLLQESLKDFSETRVLMIYLTLMPAGSALNLTQRSAYIQYKHDRFVELKLRSLSACDTHICISFTSECYGTTSSDPSGFTAE